MHEAHLGAQGAGFFRALFRSTGLTDGFAGLDAVALSFTLTVAADGGGTAVAPATEHRLTASMRDERDAAAIGARAIVFGGVGVASPANSFTGSVIVREMPFLAAPLT